MDQDSYVGFVGVQQEKERQGRSPSPRPPRPGYAPTPPGRDPSPRPNLTLPITSNQRDPSPSGKPAKPTVPPPSRIPKPEAPPPAPEMKIRNRTSSLMKRESASSIPNKSAATSVADEFKKVNVQGRPPKPTVAPPPLQTNEVKSVPLGNSKSLDGGLKNHSKKISNSSKPVRT